MQHTIAPERLQAAQHEIAAVAQRFWTFEHPETGARCRAAYDGEVLTVEIEDVPVSAGPSSTDLWDEVEQALDATAADLEARGIVRSALPSLSAVMRELRLVASDSLREIAP